MDDLLYCFKLADPSGEFEPATELLDALELDYSSIFNRESGGNKGNVFHNKVDREGAWVKG